MSTARAITYEYASGDLLEQRQTYAFSTYAGADFLHAWRASRDAARALWQARAAGDEQAAGPTAQLLRQLQSNLEQGDLQAARDLGLDRLVQRFEVSKRIHYAYDPDWRPLEDAGYRDLVLYVEFALVLVAAARHSSALSYLNALLKCMDTLSALAHMVPAGHCAHAARLIDMERALVERCALHAGVMLP
ncbi:MAG: hypothetical protein KIS79_02115 [Burkholderiales bacterium]|nr:hypothetical protein [Burkholderiales bacterium]